MKLNEYFDHEQEKRAALQAAMADIESLDKLCEVAEAALRAGDNFEDCRRLEILIIARRAMDELRQDRLNVLGKYLNAARRAEKASKA